MTIVKLTRGGKKDTTPHSNFNINGYIIPCAYISISISISTYDYKELM